MTRKEQFIDLVNRSAEHLKALGISDIGLFGSVCRGEDREGSDFDILVEFEPGKKNFRNFAEIADFLEKELGAPVELVTKEGLSPFIGPKILKEVEYVSIAS